LKEDIGKKSNSPINEIKINGKLTSEPIQMAYEFNNFFSSVGSKIAENIQPIGKDPLSYIQ